MSRYLTTTLGNSPGGFGPEHFVATGASTAFEIDAPQHQRGRVLSLAGIAIVLAAISGCGAPAPKDFGGAWTPVNRFQGAPTEIPLSPAYMFYASPMDGTVQTMLRRWATDNGLKLVYQASSDFTLYQAAASIRTTDITAALAQLSEIYAAQGLSVSADDKRILVQSTGTPPSVKR